MSSTFKTTVYLDAGDYRRLKSIARSKGVRPAMLIREAVAEYTRRHEQGSLPRTLGGVDFDVPDLAERADEFLDGFGDDGDGDGAEP